MRSSRPSLQASRVNGIDPRRANPPAPRRATAKSEALVSRRHSAAARSPVRPLETAPDALASESIRAPRQSPRFGRWPARLERRGLSIGLALALSFACSKAGAFCRYTAVSGMDSCQGGAPALYWKSSCIGYRLNQAASRQISLDQASALFAKAFAFWMAPNGSCTPSISVVQLSPTTSDRVGYDLTGPNDNLVVFRDDGWPDRPELLELETTTYDMQTGEILDADLEINSQYASFFWQNPEGDGADGGLLGEVDQDAGVANAYDLEWLAVHGAGHMLGLWHSQDEAAIMKPTLVKGERFPGGLSADDMAGICDIYPSPGVRTTTDSSGSEHPVAASDCTLAATAPAPCQPVAVDHGCAMTRGPRRSGLPLAALFAAVARFAWRRKLWA